MSKNINRTAKNSPIPRVPQSNMSYLFKRFLAAFILAICTIIVYYPSLKVPFLLDDYTKIVRNPDIRHLANIPSRLIYPYESPPQRNRNDASRPLTYLTLTLNYHFDKLDPYGYHVINIALHIAVVLLVFLLASLVFPLQRIQGIIFPFLSALFFAVHPINVNVVSYVIGRAASLAAIFYVAAVILFIQAQRESKWKLLVSTCCFMLALASNQLAITLPAVILITDLFLSDEDGLKQVKQNWKQHALYWVTLALYLGARLFYFGEMGDVEASRFVSSRMDYFLTQWVVVWKYIKMTLWPTGLSFEHMYGPLTRVIDIRILLGTALYGILLFGVIRAFKSSQINGRLLLYGTLWFFITLSPTSSVFPTTAAMAENRVYLPLIGFCLIVPFIANAFVGLVSAEERLRKCILVIVFGIYAFSLGNITMKRNLFYQNPVAMWESVLQLYPTNGRARKNLAIAYTEQGRLQEASAEYERALLVEPDDLEVRNNLAAVYFQMQQYEKSLAAFEYIVNKKPDFAVAYSNIGLVYERLENFDAAAQAYKTAIRLNPTLIQPLINLGDLSLKKGRLKDAAASYEAALKFDPRDEQIIKKLKLATR